MYILFDVGASKTRIAATTDCKEFSEPTIIKTPQSFEEFVDTFATIAKEHTGGEDIEMVVGGMTGSFDRSNGTLVNSPHLPDWNGHAISGELGEVFGADVHIENDADVVGLGEAVYGAGKGFGIVGYMTVSTGVGGGRIVDGKIDRNSIGFEIGHQIINIDGQEGMRTLEEHISGTAIKKKFGSDPRDVHDDQVWIDLATLLAKGVYNVSLHWSPDVIVLGGSMIDGDPCITFDVAKGEYGKLIEPVVGTAPEIKKAELGIINGVWGALALLNNIIDQQTV